MSKVLGTAIFEHDWQQNILFGSSQQKDTTEFNHTFSFASNGIVADLSGVFYDERTLSDIDSVTYDLKNLTYSLLGKSANISYDRINSLIIKCTGSNCWVSGLIENSGDNTILGQIDAPTGNFPYGIMHRLPYLIIKPTGIDVTAMTGLTIHQLDSGLDTTFQIGILGLHNFDYLDIESQMMINYTIAQTESAGEPRFINNETLLTPIVSGGGWAGFLGLIESRLESANVKRIMIDRMWGLPTGGVGQFGALN